MLFRISFRRGLSSERISDFSWRPEAGAAADLDHKIRNNKYLHLELNKNITEMKNFKRKEGMREVNI